MEDLERYIRALQKSITLANDLEKLIKKDRDSIVDCINGEPMRIYREQCDVAIEKIGTMKKRIKVFYSESSAG